MLVLEDPGHNEVEQNGWAQTNKTKIDKPKSYFVGADAQATGPPFAYAKGLQLKEEYDFL